MPAAMAGKDKQRRKRALLKIQGPFCYWCGNAVAAKALTLDHVIARSKGGVHAMTNLVLSCYECNQKRGAVG